MSDARIPRRCQVVLLDERRLDFSVQPRLLSSELLDMVSSHVNLHEKEYFGLYHTDDIGNKSWLSLDRKVLDHDLPKYADPILFYFAVRFYVPSITYFKEKVTVELFYLQAKSLIFKGQIHCESNLVFELGAYALQAAFGDFSSENGARSDMKKVPILPTRTLKEHPSITFCEDQVIGHYRKLNKMRKGQAIVEYLNKFRNIPTYGVHYYEVKDKGNIPWWIGMSPKGVGVYDHTDKTKPRKVYRWNQIENLYFKERKFSIEVKNLRKISEVSLDGARIRSNSLGRRSNLQNSVLLHAWYASTTVQAKDMWTMAISQHQFYLDKRDQEDKLTTPRTIEDIANELSQSNGSLNSSLASIISDSSDPSESGASANGGETGLATELAQKEMLTALKARKEALQMRLKEKTEELKRICFNEAAITGEYPPETPYNSNCPPPPVRKRVGTAFTFSDFVVKSDVAEQAGEKLEKLECELEIQSKITHAAEKLANDPKASKNVRKSRRLTYQKSFSKLKSMEQAVKRLKESRAEDITLDDNSLNSYEDDVDSKPSLSRTPSFNAATGQRKTSNTSSIDSLQSVCRVNSVQTGGGPINGSKLCNGELSDELDYLALNDTPEFASSTKINEILYRQKSNSLQYYRPIRDRRDSITSLSSMSNCGIDRGRPPPSYAESHFSRRESSFRSRPEDTRRGSAPGLYPNQNDGVEERHTKQNFENHKSTAASSSSTKVRYVGGLSSTSPSDSDYNSDDVQTNYSVAPPAIATSDYDDNGRTIYWLDTSSRNRSNIASDRFNYPSQLGIMNNSENTGSYYVNDVYFDPGGFTEKSHLYSSTSALNQQQYLSRGLTRSHYSSYSLHPSPTPRRETLMQRFFQNGHPDWSDEEDSRVSLV